MFAQDEYIFIKTNFFHLTLNKFQNLFSAVNFFCFCENFLETVCLNSISGFYSQLILEIYNFALLKKFFFCFLQKFRLFDLLMQRKVFPKIQTYFQVCFFIQDPKVVHVVPNFDASYLSNRLFF